MVGGEQTDLGISSHLTLPVALETDITTGRDRPVHGAGFCQQNCLCGRYFNCRPQRHLYVDSWGIRSSPPFPLYPRLVTWSGLQCGLWCLFGVGLCRVDLRGGVMINMPSRFNLRLAFSVRVYTTTYTNCLRWLGDHAGFGHQALGG